VTDRDQKRSSVAVGICGGALGSKALLIRGEQFSRARPLRFIWLSALPHDTFALETGIDQEAAVSPSAALDLRRGLPINVPVKNGG
jgi:hypothetical protein